MQGLTLPSCMAFSCPSIYNLSYVAEQLILGRYETQVGLFLGSNYYNSKQLHKDLHLKIRSITVYRKGFPCGSVGKESACNVGDLGLIPGWGRFPGGGNGNRHQNSCLGNPHGQRSLAGYSPWDCKESDMTE